MLAAWSWNRTPIGRVISERANQRTTPPLRVVLYCVVLLHVYVRTGFRDQTGVDAAGNGQPPDGDHDRLRLQLGAHARYPRLRALPRLGRDPSDEDDVRGRGEEPGHTGGCWKGRGDRAVL